MTYDYKTTEKDDPHLFAEALRLTKRAQAVNEKTTPFQCRQLIGECAIQLLTMREELKKNNVVMTGLRKRIQELKDQLEKTTKQEESHEDQKKETG